MRPVDDPQRKVVCIQGLGFVGAAMSLAVAMSRFPDGSPRYEVFGVDLPTVEGRKRISAINEGRFPFNTTDAELREAAAIARRQGNLVATDDADAFRRSSVTVVDVHLDVKYEKGIPVADFSGFRGAIKGLGERMPPGSLVLVETTVPPGTCEKIVAPELEAALNSRGLNGDSLLLAHSYERVMPGPGYLRSVTNFWRVFAGRTQAAAEACEAFLRSVIDTEKYPLRRLRSTTASETAKILENSYRAANIAFIDEWTRFAECVGIDLFEVIDAIRDRPTHVNIRQPGLGVGGYCLTKDPLFPGIAAREIFDRKDLEFPFSDLAVRTNAMMPLHTVDRLEGLIDGDLHGVSILILGVAYRSDVEDTRFSPSETLARELLRRGARVECHDPMVTFWEEMDVRVRKDLPPLREYDAAILAVPHSCYSEPDFLKWLAESSCALVDANRVLTKEILSSLRRGSRKVAVVGAGDME